MSELDTAAGNRLAAVDELPAKTFVEQQLQDLEADDLALAENNPLFLGVASDPFAMAPPEPGEPSYDLFVAERDAILDSLKRRAKTLVAGLNALEGVTCNEAEGAMYAFPKIDLPAKLVAEAEAAKMAPDAMYCMKLLEGTGIVVVPGSGFGQKEGTWHFRTTFLPAEADIEGVVAKISAFHAEFMDAYRN